MSLNIICWTYAVYRSKMSFRAFSVLSSANVYCVQHYKGLWPDIHWKRKKVSLNSVWAVLGTGNPMAVKSWFTHLQTSIEFCTTHMQQSTCSSPLLYLHPRYFIHSEGKNRLHTGDTTLSFSHIYEVVSFCIARLWINKQRPFPMMPYCWYLSHKLTSALYQLPTLQTKLYFVLQVGNWIKYIYPKTIDGTYCNHFFPLYLIQFC